LEFGALYLEFHFNAGANFLFFPLLLRLLERRVKIKNIKPFADLEKKGFQQSF